MRSLCGAETLLAIFVSLNLFSCRPADPQNSQENSRSTFDLSQPKSIANSEQKAQPTEESSKQKADEAKPLPQTMENTKCIVMQTEVCKNKYSGYSYNCENYAYDLCMATRDQIPIWTFDFHCEGRAAGHRINIVEVIGDKGQLEYCAFEPQWNGDHYGCWEKSAGITPSEAVQKTLCGGKLFVRSQASEQGKPQQPTNRPPSFCADNTSGQTDCRRCCGTLAFPSFGGFDANANWVNSCKSVCDQKFPEGEISEGSNNSPGVLAGFDCNAKTSAWRAASRFEQCRECCLETARLKSIPSSQVPSCMSVCNAYAK